MRGGAHPTVPWLTPEELQALAPGRVLLNAGRGGVLPDEALLATLERGAGHWVALDVFEAEPAPPPALLEAVALATPHIAGISKWIEDHLKSRFYVGKDVFVNNDNKILECLKIGFEDPKELSYFTLACPHLKYK